MRTKRHAWLALTIAIMSGYMVAAAWRVHAINDILSQMEAVNPASPLLARLDSLSVRIKNGEVKFSNASDAKLVSYTVRRTADDLRNPRHSYRDQLVPSKYVLYTALTVFVVQLGIAISAFFTKCETPAPLASSDTSAPSNSA